MLTKLISKLLSLIPTGKIITFHSCPDYADNAYAVFREICLKHSDKFRLVWLIDEKENVLEIQQKINSEGFKAKAVVKKTIKGMWLFLRSRYCFYTHGMMEQFDIRQHSDKLVNLWHGMPIKGLGLTDKQRGSAVHNQDLLIATSDVFQDIMAQCFGVDRKKVLTVGHPRCDLLFEPTEFFEQQHIDKRKYNKIGIWLPTYRCSILGDIRNDGNFNDGSISFLDENGLQKLDKDLQRLNQLLIIKLHLMDALQEHKFQSYQNILIIKPKEFHTQLYPLLGNCDYMLSDFSSVSVDFDVCRKPMGFPINDLEAYRESRGLLFDDITEVLPGPIINNYEQLVDFIANPLYTPAKIKLNDFYDNKSSARLLNKLWDSSKD